MRVGDGKGHEIELSEEATGAVDRIAFVLFCAVHQLDPNSNLPKTIARVDEALTTKLREQALALAGVVLVESAAPSFPIQVETDGSAIRWTVGNREQGGS